MMTDPEMEINAALTHLAAIGEAANRLRECGMDARAITILGLIFNEMQALKLCLERALGLPVDQGLRGGQ